MGNAIIGKCKSCVYFKADAGLCLRQAPYPAIVPMPMVQQHGILPMLAIWPSVEPEMGCGQHESSLVTL